MGKIGVNPKIIIKSLIISFTANHFAAALRQLFNTKWRTQKEHLSPYFFFSSVIKYIYNRFKMLARSEVRLNFSKMSRSCQENISEVYFVNIVLRLSVSSFKTLS
jgi:hypothetical protein